MTGQPREAAQPGPTGTGTSSAGPGPRPDRRVLLLFSLAGVVLLLVSGLGGYMLGSARPAPAEGSADVGFARDMQTHHAQAVQMAMLLREKTTDPTLRAVADDITTSQQHQAGQMYAWLAQWGLPQTGSDKPMVWMTAGGHKQNGHDTPTPPGAAGAGSMMGMASPQQIQALQQAAGRDAERLFLELMIAHHRGGVAMAKAALERADRPEVRTLAAAIDIAQAAEITQLQQLLEQRR